MSQFFRIIIYFASFYSCKSTIFQKTNFMDPVINAILEINPFQISVFQSGGISMNLILQKITQKIPMFIIDVNDTKIPNGSTSTGLNTDLYITLQDNFYVPKIENNLNFIAGSNSFQPRAKFLVIIIGDTRSIHINLKELFTYAWELKFLDFSLLFMNDKNDAIVRNYNPFFETYYRNYLSTEHLFPDKQKNMNGYKIKTILFILPPLIEFVNSSNELTVNGVNHEFWKLASENLNFTFEYVEIHNNDIPVSNIFEKIEEGEIEATINPDILGAQLSNYYKRGAFPIGRVVREANLVLVAPIRYTNSTINSEFYLTITIYSCLTTFIILFTMFIVKNIEVL